METSINSQTELQVSYTIAPVKNLEYGLSGLLGNFNAELVSRFYQPVIGRRINTIISELVNNVYENRDDDSSRMMLTIIVNGDEARIEVKNKVTTAQYEKVKRHIETIKRAEEPSRLLSETIQNRKNRNLKGGLGLIRLTSELKSVLSLRYNKASSMMTLVSKISLQEEIL